MADDMDEYQKLIEQTAIYPNRGNNLTYPTLGLCGEAGEFAEKVKKCLRDNGGIVTPEIRAAMAKELGDVLWYITACASELGLTLTGIAATNVEKLVSRREKGTLQGSGDDR